MSTGASQRAIEHHYDVGRDFYRLWLDERMVYSCGLWPGELDDDLAGAQLAKLAWHADSARAEGASAVLDIGCGWGAMLEYLTAERGVARATGLTLSTDQADSIGAPPGSRPVEVRLESWADHPAERSYDAIVSIGAFEHFARPGLSASQRRAIYGRFFERCAGWLPAGGRLSLQTIAYDDFDPATGSVSSFFSDEIFPESDLPNLADLAASFSPRFRLVALRSDADHYARTLLLWQRRLEADKDRAVEMVGRDVYRRYIRYLRVSRAMFERRVTTLYRLCLERRPGDRPSGAPSEGTER